MSLLVGGVISIASLRMLVFTPMLSNLTARIFMDGNVSLELVLVRGECHRITLIGSSN